MAYHRYKFETVESKDKNPWVHRSEFLRCWNTPHLLSELFPFALVGTKPSTFDIFNNILANLSKQNVLICGVNCFFKSMKIFSMCLPLSMFMRQSTVLLRRVKRQQNENYKPSWKTYLYTNRSTCILFYLTYPYTSCPSLLSLASNFLIYILIVSIIIIVKIER